MSEEGDSGSSGEPSRASAPDSPRTRILFVDDDVNVLGGLRRALRPLRREWDVSVVEGASQALERMGDRDFDVLVTDLRMPGMSGEALLAEVARTSPHMIRIVLSGETKLATFAAAIGPAHQYLSKPCEPEKLIATIRRSCQLRDVLTSHELRRLVAQMQSLPVRPASFDELLEEIDREDPSIGRVADIVGGDIAMSAKVMQLVNSAFFGLRQTVADPRKAVLLLGMDIIRPLVLSASVFSSMDTGASDDVSPDGIWERSARVAALTRHIAEMEELPAGVSQNAFLAGLLHDVGTLILADQLPGPSSEARKTSQQQGVPLWQSEVAVIGNSHAEVGGYLMGLWGFSNTIVEAVTHHHQPARRTAPALDEVCLVHVANALVGERSARGDDTAPLVDQDYIDQVGLGGRVDRWRETAENAGL